MVKLTAVRVLLVVSATQFAVPAPFCRAPDPWAAAVVLLEAALAAAGVIGGAAGVRIAGALRKAQNAQRAVREIIRGNEVFKRNHSAAAEAFKRAQQGQSPTTRKLVTAIKAEA